MDACITELLVVGLFLGSSACHLISVVCLIKYLPVLTKVSVFSVQGLPFGSDDVISNYRYQMVSSQAKTKVYEISWVSLNAQCDKLQLPRTLLYKPKECM